MTQLRVESRGGVFLNDGKRSFNCPITLFPAFSVNITPQPFLHQIERHIEFMLKYYTIFSIYTHTYTRTLKTTTTTTAKTEKFIVFVR